MKQTVKVLVAVSMMSFSLFAHAYPACFGTQVTSCNLVTAGLECANSYMASGAKKVQCSWSNGKCTSGGAQCQ